MVRRVARLIFLYRQSGREISCLELLVAIFGGAVGIGEHSVFFYFYRGADKDVVDTLVGVGIGMVGIECAIVLVYEQIGRAHV